MFAATVVGVGNAAASTMPSKGFRIEVTYVTPARVPVATTSPTT